MGINPLGSICRGGHRRVMELDSEIRILILDVAKGVLDLDFSSFSIGEEIVAHCKGPVSVGDHLVIREPHVCPALYCKTCIFGASVVRCHEVGQGGFESGAELIYCSQGRFEHDWSDLIRVQRIDVISCDSDVVAAIPVGTRYRNDPIAPLLLRPFNILQTNHLS